MLSFPFIDLPSGLVAGDPGSFNGIYTRNITYVMTSLERAALLETQPVLLLAESYMVEGDEDYSPAFPHTVPLARELVKLTANVSTLEALIGSVALQRRIEAGQLTAENIPASLREVHSNIISRSPWQLRLISRTTLTRCLIITLRGSSRGEYRRFAISRVRNLLGCGCSSYLDLPVSQSRDKPYVYPGTLP